MTTIFEFAKKYKRYLIFLSIFAVVLVVVTLVGRRYPIMIVNGETVSAARFKMNYRSASVYYENLLKTYARTDLAPKPLTQSDLEVGVLEQLVEAILVDHGVRREVGEDLDYLLQSKLGGYEETPALRSATETLYGLSYEDFLHEVLIPQAKKDILAGRFFLRGEKIDEWLREAKKSAHVTIFSKKFRWDGETVAISD